MKTAKEIKDEIQQVKDGLSEGIEQKSLTAKEEKSYRERLRWLNLICQYVESIPSESFVKKEIERVKERINLRMNAFVVNEKWDLMTIKKEKKKHRKSYEIPKLEEQLRALNYILK